MATKKRPIPPAGTRDICDELMEGVEAMKAYREGNITPRTYKMEEPSLPEVDAQCGEMTLGYSRAWSSNQCVRSVMV